MMKWMIYFRDRISSLQTILLKINDEIKSSSLLKESWVNYRNDLAMVIDDLITLCNALGAGVTSWGS